MPAQWCDCRVVLEDDYWRDAQDYDPVDYPLLAEGDSWFSINGQQGENLLRQLSTRGSSLILSFAHPGDEIRRMARLGESSYLHLLLREPSRFWRVWLLSGGGNDLIADIDRIIRRAPSASGVVDPAAWVSEYRLAQTLDRVCEAYRALAALRDGTAHHDMPILTHTYDYAMPRAAPASVFGFRQGPWIEPALARANVPIGMRRIVSDYLFNRLADAIGSLSYDSAGSPIRNFHVCDTRGLLRPSDPSACGDSNDWLNEIHPNRAGYRKIAQARMNQALDLLLRAD